MKRAFFFLGLIGCATASQRSTDQAELRDQETRAVPIRHPFEQLDGHVASDSLGGNYQLISVTHDELCFRSLIPSENGNEQQVAYVLSAVDEDGASRTAHAKSVLQLGLSQQTTLNTGTREGDSQKSAVGLNQNGSPQDSNETSFGGRDKSSGSVISGGSGQQPGGSAAPVKTTQDSRVDPVGGSDEYQRVCTFAAMNVCFAAQPTLTPASRFMILQRGDLGLMNPHPLRAVWSLAPISGVAKAAPQPASQHANPFPSLP